MVAYSELELFSECVSAEGEAPQRAAPAAAPPTKSIESAAAPAYAMWICSGADGARVAAAAAAAASAELRGRGGSKEGYSGQVLDQLSRTEYSEDSVSVRRCLAYAQEHDTHSSRDNDGRRTGCRKNKTRIFEEPLC